ncbi:TonB family protein [Algoriphagus sp. D3-2-R+10]|uniref:energy transducer TonB n=1 Tax=Algoriphagus aurantiacus TaxID=3103948 RepID=UPI002B3DF83E|nr:TonB family protein [Algoriphagus sp. D3-2-R+10]MEB2774161.1 TonB family protein [Algoriphagus sp. D3-2-R+10]
MKNKIEIIENVYLTPMDIEKQKDFDSILQSYKNRKASPFNWRKVMWFSLALVSFSVIGLLIFNNANQANKNESAVSDIVDYPSDDIVDQPTGEHNSSGTEFINDSTITDSALIEKTEIPANVQQQKEDNEYIEFESETIGKRETNPIDIEVPEKLPLKIEVPNKVPLIVPEEAKDIQKKLSVTLEEAHPIDGFESLYAWFETNITYPEEHRKDRIEGSVKVSFLVAEDSTISAVKVTQSLGLAFDQEAVRLIEQMPKWVPAKRNGIPFSKRFVLPIGFKIESR